MAKLKMDYFVNIEPRKNSKYWEKNKPVIEAGLRNMTFYVDGDISKVVSHSDIAGVYVVKDGQYQIISCDSFIALFRKFK